MKRIPVEASRKYDVLVGYGILENAGGYCREVIEPCKALIITDSNVEPLYSDTVTASLLNSGYSVFHYVFTAGERSKNIHTLTAILEFAAENRFTRTDIFVALGGGVTGDIAGLAAALYQRGIRYVQVPTTFLAAIDSSVGGKTAINLIAGKNLAGAFWQPSLVICDCDTFKTLPDSVFADGTAEAIKYGMITELPLFEQFEHGSISRDLDNIVTSCVNIKRRLVSRDEYDRGARQLLNFGHTIGHAIEKLSGYSISHGNAISIGMVMMSRAAEQMSMTREPCSKRLSRALERHGLETECPYKAGELLEAVLGDKKRSGDEITLVIPTRPGKCRLHTVPTGDIERILELGLKRGDE
ncbi:MAG: 3-dehydroquinate synthase [Clostridiales bacterium]|nr:3-dehydroquinate synthase [Clostridiales bacterium]